MKAWLAKNRCWIRLVMGSLLIFSPGLGWGQSREQLIVFVQDSDSPVDREFRDTYLPELTNLTRTMNLPMTLVKADQGTPDPVSITPLLVYQNYRGRSIYQGRYTTVERIKNFIRTARYIPQGKTRLVRKDIAVLRSGKARIWSPIKISSVTGTLPAGYNDQRFKTDAQKAIYAGFQQFRRVDTASFDRADRGFYMDFYPWRAQDGTLFLSLAIFSQFHCKKPVFHTRDHPLTGPFKDRERLFRQAGALMEAKVLELLKTPGTGDGFDTIAVDVPVKSWKDIGFPLPPPPAEKVQTTVDVAIPREWQLKPAAPEDPPQIQFRFPAPLDQYTGTADKAQGRFTLPDTLMPGGAGGHVTVDTQSVTMGQADLDKFIHSSLMLNVAEHPTAGFTIRSGGDDTARLAYGRMTPATFQGDFVLKGISIPLTVVASIEPLLDDQAKPLLIVDGGFEISLDTFHIDGPDGPSPQNRTLVFDVHFILTPMIHPKKN